MFLKFTKKKKIRKDLFTIGFSKRSSTVEKIKERGQISTVNDVFHYSLNTDSLGWIIFSFTGTTASKESTRCVKSMRARNTKQETFLHGTSLLLSKSCKPCHRNHDLFDRSGIFEHLNNSLQ